MASGRAWWGIVLQWSLWLIAMSATMSWLARSRAQPPERAEGRVILRNPRSTLVLGLVPGIAFLALSVACFFSVLPRTGPALGAAFLAVAALFGIIVFGYFRDFDELDANGIRYRTTFGPSGSANWRDVCKVRYSESMKWFRIDLSDGKCTRISAMMVGLPEFAAHVLEKCEHADIDGDTRTILVSTASGVPPKIWG